MSTDMIKKMTAYFKKKMSSLVKFYDTYGKRYGWGRGLYMSLIILFCS